MIKTQEIGGTFTVDVGNYDRINKPIRFPQQELIRAAALGYSDNTNSTKSLNCCSLSSTSPPFLWSLHLESDSLTVV